MESGGPINRTAFSAAALVIVLIGLPISVAGIASLSFNESGEILMPENSPGAGMVTSPMVMTSTGVHDPSIDYWCNDGAWVAGANPGEKTKIGSNWAACPFASSATAGKVNGQPAFPMYSCSWYGDPVHGTWKCGDRDLAWNIYGFEWGPQIQNESLTSFSIQFMSMTSSQQLCSDTTYFEDIVGTYSLSFNAGFSQIVGSGPGYRFIANETIQVSSGSFATYNAAFAGYDSQGNQMCVSQFSMSFDIDPWIATDVQNLAQATNLSNEWVWLTLEVDDLHVPSQSTGYDTWTGVLPWDDVEPYHGVSIRMGTVESQSATQTMQIATWGLSLAIAAFALACTPYWNPVSDFLKRGMKG
tara:strand:- start:5910 stop:6980 length:1071 start_codon:yes stop_codon:yes gene_type:complete